MKNYQAVDLINGLERHDGYTHAFFKAFTPALQNAEYLFLPINMI